MDENKYINKYMVMAISCGQEFIDIIGKISQDEPRQMIIGDSSIIVLSTTMLFDELETLLTTCEGDNNYILINFKPDTIKMKLYDGLEDFFNFKKSVIDFLGNDMVSRADNEEYFSSQLTNGELSKDNREQHNVFDFIKILNNDEISDIRNEIFDKLPKISKWERDFLQHTGEDID